MDKLPLRAENYRIRLLYFNVNTGPSAALDIVENAATLSVLPGVIYGVGKVQRSGFGSLLNAIFRVD